jgi:hypothetical protein
MLGVEGQNVADEGVNLRGQPKTDLSKGSFPDSTLPTQKGALFYPLTHGGVSSISKIGQSLSRYQRNLSGTD